MENLIALITMVSLKYGVDPSLSISIAKTESHMNTNAVGSIGEIGLFQLRPELFAPSCKGVKKAYIKNVPFEKFLEVKSGDKVTRYTGYKKVHSCGHELFDAETNIEIAIKHIAKLKKQCSKHSDAFFICHNLGVSNGLKIQSPKNFPYYKKVAANMVVLKKGSKIVAMAE